MVFKAIISALILIFSIVPLMPISYLLIGFPEPELWRLPFVTQLMISIDFYINLLYSMKTTILFTVIYWVNVLLLDFIVLGYTNYLLVHFFSS